MNLRAQQLAFADAVCSGNDDAAAPLSLKERADGGVALLGIYRHAYAARLVEALRDNYEVLARAMGDAAFDALARAYVAQHPSRLPSIRWYGDGLADFMDHHADLVAHPAFADLARMDWALRSAFDAPDAEPLQREQLAALRAEDWPTLRLSLHPSVRIVALHWSVEAAWHVLRAHADGESGAEPELPTPTELPHDLLAWRPALETRWRSLVDAESHLLRLLAKGCDFATLCDAATQHTTAGDDGVAATRLVTLLGQWLAEGLIGRYAAGDDAQP